MAESGVKHNKSNHKSSSSRTRSMIAVIWNNGISKYLDQHLTDAKIDNTQ
jgi:hypothetical protein